MACAATPRLRPRLLAAVVRSNATLAFAAERQVVIPTKAMAPDFRIPSWKGPVLVLAGLLLCGVVVFMVKYPSYKRAMEIVRQQSKSSEANRR